MSYKNKILTKNDFYVIFDKEKKMYKACFMFYIRQPDDENETLLEWGHLRVFKGSGDTKNQAILKCTNSIKESLSQLLMN